MYLLTKSKGSLLIILVRITTVVTLEVADLRAGIRSVIHIPAILVVLLLLIIIGV